MDRLSQPTVRIQYAKLLDPVFRALFLAKQELGKIDSLAHYPAPEATTSAVESFQAAWVERESTLPYLESLLGLHYAQTSLDAYVVGEMKGGISSPIVIGSNRSPEAFVDALTHELVHVLISDNRERLALPAIFDKFFPHEPHSTKVHALIFAVMTKLLGEHLQQPVRLAACRKLDEAASEYLRAWSLVDQFGPDQVIESFRSYYPC